MPLVVTGNSMLPFLVDGRDQVLIKEVNRSLRKGDIAFFSEKEWTVYHAQDPLYQTESEDR